MEPLIDDLAFDNGDTAVLTGFLYHPYLCNVLLYPADVWCMCLLLLLSSSHPYTPLRKTLPVLQMLLSNHPLGCSNYKFHFHGKGRRRNCAACHYAYLKMLPGRCASLCCNAELEVTEVGFYKLCDAFWYLEKRAAHKILRTDPKALARCRKTACKPFFSLLGIWIWYKMTKSESLLLFTMPLV